MNLFQLIDGDGENIGLYNVTNSELSNDQITILLRDNWDDEDADEILAVHGIERVYVTEIYTNNPF
jgi:hypothetical protein